MQKIQVNQGRALEKITDENEFPARIKCLLEELRCANQRNRELEKKMREQDKA